MSYGERASSYLLSQIFLAQGVTTRLLDAGKVIVTDATHGNATVDGDSTYTRIRDQLHGEEGITVVPGFIGATTSGETTTLGRGGSDLTAALFGRALEVEEIQIWTDVAGVMTADPRKVKKAFLHTPPKLRRSDGALTLRRKGYLPTHRCNQRSTAIFRFACATPSFPRNLALSSAARKPPSEAIVTGITAINQVALLRVEGSGMVGVAGTAERLFRALAAEKISVILISQASSEHSICLAISDAHREKAIGAISKEFTLELETRQLNPIQVERDRSIVAVVGENMRHTPGISGRVFSALGQNGVNVIAIAQGSSELNISIVIDSYDEAKALNALHDAFFLSRVKTLHLFVVGTGLVGRALLSQLDEQIHTLWEDYALDLRIIALANSRKMIFSEEGLALNDWQEEMEIRGTPGTIETFVEKMVACNLPNTVFVDCTASDEVASCYSQILGHSISVVTPNKRAISGSYAQYREIKDAAARSNVKYYYETNVGAGLPVLSTLQDLLLSGDEILKIEAVLSGT